MEIRISGKSTEISEDLQAFTLRKVGKLEKFSSRDMSAMVTLSEQAGKKGAKTHRAEVVMHLKGKVISAREGAENFFIAVDAVVEKLRRQLKKEKSKRLEKTKDIRDLQHAGMIEETKADAAAAGEADEIKVRSFALKPMSVEEALTALEGSNQSFYLFVNDDQVINCVYRLENGSYGLLVPESAR